MLLYPSCGMQCSSILAQPWHVPVLLDCSLITDILVAVGLSVLKHVIIEMTPFKKADVCFCRAESSQRNKIGLNSEFRITKVTVQWYRKYLFEIPSAESLLMLVTTATGA